MSASVGPVSNESSDARARQAIEQALDDTLVVEAAAGTGKTTELVKRILRVLATGRAEMKGIVAVTFTEKAAGELKLRLREALEHARAETGDEHVRARLEQALETLEEAHVNTIHGFCADLLRERPVEARVDPLFAVLTEPQADRLYARAFRDWLQEAMRDPPEGLRRALRRTSAPSFASTGGDGPIDRLRRAGRQLAEWRDFPAPWRRPPFDRAAAIDRLLAALHRLATVTASPSFAARQPVRGHRRRSPARVVRSSSNSRSASATTTGGRRGWSISSATGGSRGPERAAATSTARTSPAPRSSPHATRCSPTSSSSAGTPMRIWPPAFKRSLAARPGAIRRSRPRPARSTSPIC